MRLGLSSWENNFSTPVMQGSSTLAGTSLSGPGSYTLTFHPTVTGTANLVIFNSGSSAGVIYIAQIELDTFAFVSYTGLLTISSNSSYKYGYNGQVRDDEWAGTGNYLDFKYRGYNPRIARFQSVDPLTAKYPWYTPYQFAGNKVIQFRELEGLEEGEAEGARPEEIKEEENDRQQKLMKNYEREKKKKKKLPKNKI